LLKESSKLPVKEDHSTPSPAKRSKSKSKVYPDFDESGITKDLSRDGKTSVESLKFKIGSGTIVESRMITAEETKLEYDYAAIIIHRRMKDNKSFMFNLPLNLLPPLMDALKIIKIRIQNFWT